MSLRLTFLSLLAILPACGDPKPQTTEDTASSGSSASSGEATDGTVGMSSAPTTGEVSATTDGSDSMTSSVTTSVGTTTSATDGNATEDPATTSTTTAGETTGPVDPGIAEHCGAVCGQLVECKVMNDLDTCISECSDGFSDPDPACTTANGDLLTCIETMNCAQIVAFFVDEDPGPCAKEFEAQNLSCQGSECVGSVGSNEQGTECSVSSECVNAPKLEMTCDANTCTCTSDGEKTGECPSEGVCEDIALLSAKSEACCGF